MLLFTLGFVVFVFAYPQINFPTLLKQPSLGTTVTLQGTLSITYANYPGGATYHLYVPVGGDVAPVIYELIVSENSGNLYAYNDQQIEVTGNYGTQNGNQVIYVTSWRPLTTTSGAVYTGVIMPGGFEGCQLLIGDNGQTYGLDGLPAPDGVNGPAGSWTNWHVTLHGTPTTPRAPCATTWIHVTSVEGWYLVITTTMIRLTTLTQSDSTTTITQTISMTTTTTTSQNDPVAITEFGSGIVMMIAGLALAIFPAVAMKRLK
jgi:hypothetical protein